MEQKLNFPFISVKTANEKSPCQQRTGLYMIQLNWLQFAVTGVNNPNDVENCIQLCDDVRQRCTSLSNILIKRTS
ncbi:Anhydro-N-acetylmuramic acid kinase [Trichinella pseudospiralis]